VQALVDKAVTTFSKIDVLINNAGIMPIAPMSEVRTGFMQILFDSSMI
jgi:hypothetical protein